jgi:hypothetical protein
MARLTIVTHCSPSLLVERGAACFPSSPIGVVTHNDIQLRRSTKQPTVGLLGIEAVAHPSPSDSYTATVTNP